MRYNPATEDPDRPHSVEELARPSAPTPAQRGWHYTARFWVTDDEDAFLTEALRRYRAGEGF